MAIFGGFCYRGLWFGFYDYGKAVLGYHHTNSTRCRIKKFMLANVVSISAGYVTFPIDTIGRRMIMQAGRGSRKRQYSSSLDCLVKMVQQEGAASLYKGSHSNALRCVGIAMIFVLYDDLKHYFEKVCGY